MDLKKEEVNENGTNMRSIASSWSEVLGMKLSSYLKNLVWNRETGEVGPDNSVEGYATICHNFDIGFYESRISKFHQFWKWKGLYIREKD